MHNAIKQIDGKIILWRRKGERYKSNFATTMTYGGESIMVGLIK